MKPGGAMYVGINVMTIMNSRSNAYLSEYGVFEIEGLHPFSKAVLSKKYTVLFAVPLLCPYRASDRLGKMRTVRQAGWSKNRNIANKCDILWPFFNSRACSSVGQSRGLIIPWSWVQVPPGPVF